MFYVHPDKGSVWIGGNVGSLVTVYSRGQGMACTVVVTNQCCPNNSTFKAKFQTHERTSFFRSGNHLCSMTLAIQSKCFGILFMSDSNMNTAISGQWTRLNFSQWSECAHPQELSKDLVILTYEGGHISLRILLSAVLTSSVWRYIQ